MHAYMWHVCVCVFLNIRSYLQLSACLVLLGRNQVRVKRLKKWFSVEFNVTKVPHPIPSRSSELMKIDHLITAEAEKGCDLGKD